MYRLTDLFAPSSAQIAIQVPQNSPMTETKGLEVTGTPERGPAWHESDRINSNATLGSRLTLSECTTSTVTSQKLPPHILLVSYNPRDVLYHWPHPRIFADNCAEIRTGGSVFARKYNIRSYSELIPFWLQNNNGVIMHLKAKREGLMLSLGGDAVVI